MTNKITIKQAILQTLEETQDKMDYKEVYDYVIQHNLYNFGSAKTPSNIIASGLGNFIRNNDNRVKRLKVNNVFMYYLTKYEDNIEFEEETTAITLEKSKQESDKPVQTFNERDLHKLFASFLKSQDIYPKTILHERSNRSEEHQRWIHPDMVGLKRITLKNDHSNALREIVHRNDSFNLYSYELKKTINSDYELKKCFFQAVSNSSWANYGYLVALDISENLHDELERLNKAFGIGIIELSANVFETKILFPAHYKRLDFQTIDKLCESNRDFAKFIEQTKGLLSVDKRFYQPTLNKFEQFCDEYFNDNSDEEIKNYCIEHSIPYEYEELIFSDL